MESTTIPVVDMTLADSDDEEISCFRSQESGNRARSEPVVSRTVVHGSSGEMGRDMSESEHDDDTMSLPSAGDGLSDIDPATVECTEESNMMEEVVDMTFVGSFRSAFESLDSVDLRRTLMRRPVLMKSPPVFMRGSIRCAWRVALQECQEGQEQDNDDRSVRGWKLFLLLP